ncbi:hypothetical protein [Nesterenkonia sandarakina]|uniref:Uncharacterized protein n=1 Tax=Nesterenkonia sandarakina TaxID=272918 RepID=A0A2T0YSE1_9MICC|nr:hypothetical protein [Nesterenkonia sandarakina]PRZ18699.1 hypothetical protein BCL67_1015 [Nesterenkonia sandarakina]
MRVCHGLGAAAMVSEHEEDFPQCCLLVGNPEEQRVHRKYLLVVGRKCRFCGILKVITKCRFNMFTGRLEEVVLPEYNGMLVSEVEQ